MKTILLIEDDTDMRENTAEILELANYRVIRAENGRRGVEAARKEVPDLVLCDIMMPELDGYGVLHMLGRDPATAEVPFIFLSAKAERGDVRKGMELGADDYLTKPFQVAELVARVQALVRRAAGNASSILEIGGVRLDMAASQVWYEGTPIKLTAHEFRVLGYLMQHRGKVVSRSELIDHIYAQDFDRDSNTVEVFIGRIRKKTHADLIETVRGLGYRINE